MNKLNRTTRAAQRPPLTLVSRNPALEGDGPEPTRRDLIRINRERRLVAAEVAVVDAEIAILNAPNGPTALDWQRLRRARRQVLREAADLKLSWDPAPAVWEAA